MLKKTLVFLAFSLLLASCGGAKASLSSNSQASSEESEVSSSESISSETEESSVISSTEDTESDGPIEGPIILI